MKNKLTAFFAIIFLSFTIKGNAQTTFTGKPIYQILTKRAGVYLGTTTVELFPNIAPLHVANFDSLVNVQFFDSTAFHRVIPGFMIQGGDPNSRHGPISTWGYGQPSQPTVNAEFSVARHLRGILSAARDADTNSANSQFFICVAPAAWLNGQYTVYGHVTAGMDIVDTIVNSPRDANDNPLQKIEMFITRIGSNDNVPNAPVLNLPATNSYSSSTGRTLKWFTESDGIIYHLQVSTDSLFATFYKSVNVAINSYTVTGLTQGTKYYWRVNTNNGGHTSIYSDVWSFTVGTVGVELLNSETDKIIVSPNPSKGEFVFSNLEKGNSITIYDMSGKLITTTVAKGAQEKINLTTNSKGIYFYKIFDKQKQIQEGKVVLE